MVNKSLVGMYKRFKKKVKEEKIYDNRRESEILFQARANCLALNNRYRHIAGREGETVCDLCRNGVEDLEHLMLKCKELEGKRNREIIEEGRREDKEEWMGNILWESEDMCGVKEEARALVF